jgi:hypothetical protein
VKLAAHGLQVTLPPRWGGHIFARPGGNASLHAGDFRLRLGDGEFGDASTAQMPPGSAFVALVEYLPGAGLAPGRGLYAPTRIRLPLDPTAFAPRNLAHTRPGQEGCQQFFTAAGRPMCLYVVIASGGDRLVRRRQLAVLDRVLGSLRVVALGGAGAGDGESVPV